mgnify:CR=1 FL=1|jgi:LEA14-like dessication related protein
MKKWIFIALLVVIGVGYYIYQQGISIKQPEFKSISNFNVDSVVKYMAYVKCDVNLYNPNKLGAQLYNTELKILSNGVEIGEVFQSSHTEIPPQSEFIVPLSFKIDLIKGGYSQTLSGLINQALSKEKKLPVKFKGVARIKALGITQKVDIEFDDELTIK